MPTTTCQTVATYSNVILSWAKDLVGMRTIFLAKAHMLVANVNA